MSIPRSFEECDCSCHTTGAMHVVACCSTCKHCRKRIRISYLLEHEKNCPYGEKPQVIKDLESQFPNSCLLTPERESDEEPVTSDEEDTLA